MLFMRIAVVIASFLAKCDSFHRDEMIITLTKRTMIYADGIFVFSLIKSAVIWIRHGQLARVIVWHKDILVVVSTHLQQCGAFVT